MSKYFNWPASLKRLVRFDSARAEDVNDALDELTAGLDTLDVDVDRAIKLPAGTADQTLALAAGQRANLLLAFDASGNITAIAGGGRWRGDWTAGASYVVSDYFRDPESKNIYAVMAAHAATTLAADLAAGRVQLAINVADVEAARSQAQSAAATATTQADIAKTQADAARAIANFVGLWSTLSGPLNKPATTYHAGRFYVLVNNLGDVAASEPGVSVDWIAAGGGGAELVAYDSRAALRTMSPAQGAMAVVQGLGLFAWEPGSTEPDDDESCFATSTGRWLLACPAWDVVSAWQSPDNDVREAWDEDEAARTASSVASGFAARVLHGTATCAITSVAATTSVTFTGTVTGAAVGDRVLVTPPGDLGATSADTARLSFHAYVSASNTVTVVLCNASASTATTSTAVRAAWPITVFKGV